ncbi:DUF6538 domain-containing protein [Celeribacter ethanolicus]|uniref:DUF6538 domain-containing protein n=1 Tax=Celeribacter ethanolicus TaxID=1758178 RepID=UPI0012DFCDED|nr:DUF6538 domain-containing protein [Celeribacter ethanolicus]
MRKQIRYLHLERRQSAYYWRRRLPIFFQKNASNSFFVFSLRTHVVREAEVLASRLTWLSNLAFDYARGEAAARRGFALKDRGKVDEGGKPEAHSQHHKSKCGRALGDRARRS